MAASPSPSSPSQEPPTSSPLSSPADVVWPPHILSYSELDLKASHYSDSLILPQLDGSKLEYSSGLLGTYFPTPPSELDLTRRFDPLLLHKYGVGAPDLEVLEGGSSYILDSHFLSHQDLFHPLESPRILVPPPTTPTAREEQDLVERLSSYPVLPPGTSTPRFALDTPSTAATVLVPAPVVDPAVSTPSEVQDNFASHQPLETSEYVSSKSPSPPSLQSPEEPLVVECEVYDTALLSPPPPTKEVAADPQEAATFLPEEEEPPSEIPPEYQALANHYSRTRCEDCQQTHRGECPNKTVKLIPDKPVLTRAWASLPASYLFVSKVADGEELGVFAKKSIPKRTQFGPVEGVLVPHTTSSTPPKFPLKLKNEEGQECYLDTSDEMRSNWMQFVRPAESCSQQNLAVVQQDDALYFHTTRSITIRSELRVWYSDSYAQQYSLPPLLPSAEDQLLLDEDSWPCFECEAKFSTSAELQLHLNGHDKQRTGHRKSHRRPNKKREADKVAVSKYKKLKGKTAKKPKDQECSQKEDGAATTTPEGIVLLEEGEEELTVALPTQATPARVVTPTEEVRAHTCTICHKNFPRVYSLQRHMILHSGEKKYQCPVCGLRFSQVYNRNRHVQRHKSQTDGSSQQIRAEDKECAQCQLVFPTPELVALHRRCHDDPPQEAKDGPHRCPFCDADFPEGQALGDHVRVHAKAKTFKCNLCHKKYTTEERLSQHLALHASKKERPYTCSVCQKTFANSVALTCHLRVHSRTDAKIYKCPFCDEKFEYSFALRNHVKIHVIDGVFTCPYCFKTFSEYNSARKHIRTYHGDSKFRCEECGKEFTRPDKLRMHMLRHSDHREFLCSACGKQFKRKDKLKDHMQRVHDPQKEAALAAIMEQRAKNKFVPKVSPSEYHRFIYKCHLCLLGFKRRGMLVNHLAKRHPEVPPDSVPELNLPILKTTRDYYCQYCSKIYKSSSKRKAHILKNHPGSRLPVTKEERAPDLSFSHTVGSITTHPHHCPCCHKQYASKAKLLQHERRKHPELWDNSAQEQIMPAGHSEDPSKDSASKSPSGTPPPVPSLTQMSAALAELLLAQRVGGGSAIVIDTTRQRIYVEGAAATSVAAVNAQQASTPNNDVLTQAMSELTQALVEYRSPTGQYLITRVVPQDSPAAQPTALMAGDTEEGANLEHILAQYPQLGFPWLGELTEEANTTEAKLESIPQ